MTELMERKGENGMKGLFWIARASFWYWCKLRWEFTRVWEMACAAYYVNLEDDNFPMTPREAVEEDIDCMRRN